MRLPNEKPADPSTCKHPFSDEAGFCYACGSRPFKPSDEAMPFQPPKTLHQSHASSKFEDDALP